MEDDFLGRLSDQLNAALQYLSRQRNLLKFYSSAVLPYVIFHQISSSATFRNKGGSGLIKHFGGFLLKSQILVVGNF